MLFSVGDWPDFTFSIKATRQALALSQLPKKSRIFDSSLDSSWMQVGQSNSMIKYAHLVIVGVLAKNLKKEHVM